VNVDVDIRGVARFWEDGRAHINEHGNVSISANGKTITQVWNVNIKSSADTLTFNEDETLTVQFRDSISGTDNKAIGPDGKVLIKDVGRLVVDVTLTIDLETDEIIDVVEEVVSESGQHPIFEAGGLDPSQACELLA
jgi:hypothetical protein